MVLKVNRKRMNGLKKLKEVELLKKLSHQNILQYVRMIVFYVCVVCVDAYLCVCECVCVCVRVHVHTSVCVC